jgi:hypothetical protein
MEMWFKPTASTGGWYSLMSKSIYNNSQGFVLVLYNGTVGLIAGSQDVYGTGTYTANAWNHVAVTYSSGNWVVYLNGVAEITHGATYANPTSPLVIGMRNSNDGSFFGDNYSGQIDEFRVWNTALSQSAIQTNMDSKLTGTESGLVAYYDFNQGTGGGNNTSISTLTDRTANGLTGTLAGFALTGTSSNFVTSDLQYAPYLAAQSFAIWEGSSIGASVGQLTATDENNQTITYSILSGNNDGKFTLNPSTGSITVAGALDFATTQQYLLEVQVTDDGSPTKSRTANITIDIISNAASTNDPKALAGIYAYPNPARNEFYITSEELIQIRIRDAKGALVLDTKTQNMPVNLTGLNNGLYSLELIKGEYSKTSKLIIE